MTTKLRFFIWLFCLFTITGAVKAQVTIGAGTAPQKFSILEIVSNSNSGMRLPHLTTAERDALSSTTEFIAEDHRGDATTSTVPGLGLGLTIYNTDVNCIEYWDGYKWVSLCLGTANIVLKSSCGDYDPQNPPLASADGNPSNCEYTPEDKPACVVPSGKAYDVYLTAGGIYATLTVDELTSAFTVNFSPNNSSTSRNAVVRVVNNCTGEFKDFVFPQDKATCSGHPNPILNVTTLDLCSGGSVFAHVTNAVAGVDYIWTYAGVIVHTGTWCEIKRAGIYKVYTELLGCGTAETLTVTDNTTSAPSSVTISATNGGILCGGSGTVVLTANTTTSVLWYHQGIPLTGANKNDNPLTLSGAGEAGEWFATVVDPGGCVSSPSDVLTLIDNTSGSTALPVPVAQVNGQSLTGGSITACKGGTLLLEVNNAASYPAGTEYEWFNNGVSIGKGTASVMTYLVDQNASNIVLSVTASDQSSSCPSTAVSTQIPVNLTAPGITSINNGQTQAAICGATPASLLADHSGGTTYEWFLNSAVISGAAVNNYSASQTGNYSVRYKDGSGCWSPVSTSIHVVQSAPISMTWNPKPVDVVKDDTQTYSIIANPAASGYLWSTNSSNPNAVKSIKPMGNGSSAVVKYGDKIDLPVGTEPNVEIVVQSVNHLCGDATIRETIQVKDGCITGTSVNLTPNGTISATEGGAIVNFTVATNASNNNNDLKYEWFVGPKGGTLISQGAASATNTFSFNPVIKGDYRVEVRVTNECTLASHNVRGGADVKVKVNINNYINDTSGDFRLTGKDCYDIAMGNFDIACGMQTQRTGDFFVSGTNRTWDANKQFVYTFIKVGVTNYTDLEFVTSDPNVLIKTETSNIAGRTFTLKFDQSVLTKAANRDRNNPLILTIYALYKVGATMYKVGFVAKVQDCMCGCGAYAEGGKWLKFMCYNLGADESVGDPFTPHKKLHGDFYQWGRKNVGAFGPNAANPDAVNSWDKKGKVDYTSWNTGLNASNNPCPTGWRLPGSRELFEMTYNAPNVVRRTATWTPGATQFLSGIWFGNYLFLPSQGMRYNVNGQLLDRGITATYWTADANKDKDNMAAPYKWSWRENDGGWASVSEHWGFPVRCVQD